MSNQATVPWSRRSSFWGYVTGMACLVRGGSYAVLPPAPNSLSSKTFEQILSYGEWSWLLFLVGAGIILATVFQSARWAFTFHLVAFFCFLTFAYSSIGGIFGWITQSSFQPPPPFWIQLLALGESVLVLKQGWTGIFPLVVVAMLNGERVLNLGAIIRLESTARQIAKLQSRDES